MASRNICSQAGTPTRRSSRPRFQGRKPCREWTHVSLLLVGALRPGEGPLAPLHTLPILVGYPSPLSSSFPTSVRASMRGPSVPPRPPTSISPARVREATCMILAKGFARKPAAAKALDSPSAGEGPPRQVRDPPRSPATSGTPPCMSPSRPSRAAPLEAASRRMLGACGIAFEPRQGLHPGPS